MNLEEKIARSIDAKFEEMAQLFNDVDDAQMDLSALKKLKAAIPLLQDLKTEVKSLENWLKFPQKPQEEDEDDEQDDSPISDPEAEDFIEDQREQIPLRKRLLDALRRLPKDDEVRRELLREQDNLPDLVGVDLIPPFLALEIAQKAWRIGKDLVDEANRNVELQEALRNGDITRTEKLKQEILNKVQTTQQILEDLSRDEEEELNRYLEQLYDQVIDEMARKFYQLGQDMSQCCGNMSNAIQEVGRDVGDVDRKVSLMEPAKSAGNDLAIMSKMGAVLSELQTIRGWL